ncbi:alanine/ornithine racemase family PLP-dependent enzyme [Labrenzia sp. 011]|uniref:alanine/ornithine racemase family PLP-dependent enzyme n=1 Tax=Labrenzia sp. 011 TaxID=2171494 RepID=UPI000D512B66|nr:alanine/ornithine racemase family PLP-dependent enzyme [Labrenzia sp. 011]PVB62888.1 alanine racemase [Labrenzia sp. 011]
MSAPRLEVDLEKIRHNASALVSQLRGHGISVTGVTKACLGEPRFANALLGAGVRGLGDSRIENIEAMRRAGITAPMTLIRSPMPSQAGRVVAHADISFNTELDVISALSTAAQRAGRRHGVVLMVEMGDLREGIMPGDLQETVRAALRFPNIDLKGIGTNLACQSGVSPDAGNMSDLSRLADLLDEAFGLVTRLVSGGNSSNLKWALSSEKAGRVNNLRLGESILLGLDPLDRQPIEGLYTNAISLVAEVIEAKTKPSRPWGTIGQAAFGTMPVSGKDGGSDFRTILALGRQDIDPLGLTAAPGIEVLGASSDHLMVDTGRSYVTAGSEMTFQLNYSALLRAMTSPFVTKTYSLPAGQGAFETRMVPGPRSSEELHQWH